MGQKRGSLQVRILRGLGVRGADIARARHRLTHVQLYTKVIESQGESAAGARKLVRRGCAAIPRHLDGGPSRLRARKGYPSGPFDFAQGRRNDELAYWNRGFRRGRGREKTKSNAETLSTQRVAEKRNPRAQSVRSSGQA